MKDITIENRKAYYDYYVLESLECGIELKGNEVKSIKSGKANIKDAWCRVVNNEMFIMGMHISKWDTSNMFDIDEQRVKKLLLHKNEINKIANQVKLNGVTLIPLKVYVKQGKIKVMLGICKGKHNYDKRKVEADKQAKRDIDRAVRDLAKSN